MSDIFKKNPNLLQRAKGFLEAWTPGETAIFIAIMLVLGSLWLFWMHPHK
jgi:hypothetical protein